MLSLTNDDDHCCTNIYDVTPVFEYLILPLNVVYIHCNSKTVILLTFLGFDTLGILHGEMLQWYIRALVNSFVIVGLPLNISDVVTRITQT
jgi:hypothetical protein